MFLRVTSLAGALVVLAGPTVSLSGEPSADRVALQAKYRRPAEIPFPASNPYSEAKANLGRMLFFDPLLSGSQLRSCASCHNPALSWGDGQAKSVGEKPMASRAPTLLNVAWTSKPGWIGHFRDLEAVAYGPIVAPGIMNLPEQELNRRLSAIPGYVAAFDVAFGEGDVTRRKVELALATFQRTIVSTEAPFDRWVNGEESAISASAKRGFDLFNTKAQCAGCHDDWSFTDASFHDIGSAKNDDIGRAKLFPNSVKLRYAFKTPTLRDVARRAPYMHDGALATLEEVIDLYDRGGIDRPSRSDKIKPLHLSKEEKADLIAFLHTLSGAPETVAIPLMPR